MTLVLAERPAAGAAEGLLGTTAAPGARADGAGAGFSMGSLMSCTPAFDAGRPAVVPAAVTRLAGRRG